MSKFFGIISTIGIVSAIVLYKFNPSLSMEIASGSFILWIGCATSYEEEANNGR